FPLERCEIASPAHHVELELITTVLVGAIEALAANDVERQERAGPPGVDQIHGHAEPPLELVLQEQNLLQGLRLSKEDADVDVGLVRVLSPAPGTEQIEGQDAAIRRQRLELASDLEAGEAAMHGILHAQT